jgi:hypothetical protein
MSTKRLALLGLPGTGKSAYLGTLQHMVEEPSVEEVAEADLPENPRHVQELADANRAMESLPRTRSDADESYRALVEFVGRGTVSLDLHDRSGEQLQALVELRTWPNLLREEIRLADGLLLFVSPDTVQAPLSHKVTAAWESQLPDPELAEAGGTSTERVENEVVASEGDDVTYSNHMACTAAKVVDGLENILDAMAPRWPVRVAVVVSKFDLTDETSPDEWLRARLPALTNMLDASSGRLQWTSFGVSALGGSVQEAESVLGQGDLHERATAVDAGACSVSFAAPVSWALGWE